MAGVARHGGSRHGCSWGAQAGLKASGEKPLEAAESSRSFRRPLCQINTAQNCRTREIPGATPPPPLCDIPSGCGFFTGPWTVTRSSLRVLHRVAAFCRPLRPVLLLVSFPRSRSPVVGVPGLCWMWRDGPFARQQRLVVGVVLVVAGVPLPVQAPVRLRDIN